MGFFQDLRDLGAALRAEPGRRRQRQRDKQLKSISVQLGKRSAFDSAEISSLFGGWSTMSKPINAEIESELRTLRARSRQLAKNDPYLRRFYQLLRSNIIGSKGFTFRSDVMHTLGRNAGKPDEEAQLAIEKAWKRFLKPEVMCALDKLSGIEIQNLLSDQLFRDGEIILMQVRDDTNGFGIAFRFIDPELMDVNHRDHKPGGRRVRMGIETDSKGKVVAYHFHSTDTTHESYYSVGGRGYIRIEKRFIIHRFFTEYVDQLRGIPHSVAAMSRLKMLSGYEDGELVKMRQGASAMGFIERGEGGRGFEGGEFDDEDEVEGNEVNDDEPEIVAEPGRFHYIANGAKVHSWNPSQPSTAYKDYIKAILRGVASGLGVDYNTLANDLEGVNFSSLRGGILESRELWKSLQEWMIDHVMETIFERWITAALLKGAIQLPNGKPLQSMGLERLSEHHFQGRRWAWVDPEKDIKAALLEIDNGLKSRSSYIRDQNLDPQQVWREIEQENKIMEERGVKVVTQNSKPPNEEDSDGSDDPDEQEETEDAEPEKS